MVSSVLVTVATALAAGNVLPLAVLGGVRLDGYRTFRSSLVFGLVLFAAVMLVEGVAAIDSSFRWGAFYADTRFAEQFVAGLRGRQVLTRAVAYVSWR